MTPIITNQVNPSLWNNYRHELFKGGKQAFFKLLVAAPLAITLLLILVQLIIKAFSEVNQEIPSSANASLGYDFGSEGTFAVANRLMFYQFGSVYSLILIIACALSVANEYRWNTIKMLALRQPSRVKLVFSKILFAFTFLFSVYCSLVAAWFFWAIFLKYFYNTSSTITSADWDAIGKGLQYYTFSSIQTVILAIFAIGMAFLFKSVVGGVVTYLVYNGLDSAVSSIGAQFSNNVFRDPPEWALPFLRSSKMLSPFLINSSTSRITMEERLSPFGLTGARSFPNPLIISSTPVWQAWVVLGVYLVLFTGLAVFIYTVRDITD